MRKKYQNVNEKSNLEKGAGVEYHHWKMGISGFLKYYRIFQKYIGHRILLLGAISLVTTLTEGVGIALFFAYLQSMAASGPQPALVTKLYSILSYVGLPTSPTTVIMIMIGSFILRGILVLLQNAYQFRLYVMLTQRMTGQVVDSFATMRYLDYLKRNTGHFTHIATKEVHSSLLAFYQVNALIPKGISILTYLVLSLQFQWRFTLLAIFFGLLISVIFKTVNRTTKKYSLELSSNEAVQTSLLIQFLHAFKYLYSTNNTKVMQDKLKGVSKRIAFIGSRIGMLAAVIPAASEPLIVFFIAACVFYHTQVLKAEISTLMVAIMFLYRVMRESTVLQGSWQTLNQYSSGVDRVQECLLELEKNREPSRTGDVGKIARGISLKNISFAYSDKNVLSEVNLEVPAKAMVGFVGESGSGKSTLVDIIAGVLKPTSGMISLDDKEYGQLNLRALHQKIGYVTQDSMLFDDTVANNVSLWKFEEDSAFSEGRIWKALKDAGCEEFVKNMSDGIRQKLGDRGMRLSGGQRQRIAIARELYRDPELLILDEATSALDSESEADIQRSIDAMKGKVTVIVIAHRLSTVKNCDKIFVLEKGKVVESGNFNTLIKSGPVFKRMCEIQSLA